MYFIIIYLLFALFIIGSLIVFVLKELIVKEPQEH